MRDLGHASWLETSPKIIRERNKADAVRTNSNTGQSWRRQPLGVAVGVDDRATARAVHIANFGLRR